MSFDAKVYRVMIASPSDVAEEREAAVQTIHDWNDEKSTREGVVLLPIRWEKHSAPELGDRPQGLINKHLVATSDILIAMFWSKLGSDTGKEASGTVEEIKEFQNAGKLVMLYFSEARLPHDLDLKQFEQLGEFKRRVRTERLGLYNTFKGVDDLREQLRRHLDIHVSRMKAEAEAAKPKPQPVFEPTPPAPLAHMSQMIPTASSQRRKSGIGGLVQHNATERARREFEDAVMQSRFHGFRLKPCTVAISVITSDPHIRPNRLAFGTISDDRLREIIAPISDSPTFRIERFREQVIAIQPEGKEESTAITELTHMCSMFAMGVWQTRKLGDPHPLLAFNPISEWPTLIASVTRYLNGVQSLGFHGVVEARLALLNFSQTIAIPEFDMRFGVGRINSDESILLNPVSVGLNRPVTESFVRGIMRAAFLDVWLHYGWPGVPQVDSGGHFTGVEEFGTAPEDVNTGDF
jgi:hypothetical protein